MSLFFNVNVVDVNGDVCDTTDRNDGDDDDKNSIDNQADAVDAVDGDDSNTSGIKTLDKVGFFFQPLKANYRSCFL
jgi:hypothetical protein